MADVALAVDIGGTKLAAGIVRPTGPRGPGAAADAGHPRATGEWRRSGGTPVAGRGGARPRSRRDPAGRGPARRLRGGLRRAHDPRGRGGLTAQHHSVALLPAALPAGRSDRAADVRRQRRQGAGARGGLGRCGSRRTELHRHGGVDRCRRWGRAGRAVARRATGQCGTRRPHSGRAGGAPLPLRQPRMPGGGGLGYRAGGDDRCAGASRTAGTGAADRDDGGPRNRLGGQSARSPAGRRQRLGRAGIRRCLLPGGPD